LGVIINPGGGGRLGGGNVTADKTSGDGKIVGQTLGSSQLRGEGGQRKKA